MTDCYTQVPESVKGKDVSVTLRDGRALEIEARIGNQDVRRVEGLLRRPVKGFGNGSTWELTLEEGGRYMGSYCQTAIQSDTILQQQHHFGRLAPCTEGTGSPILGALYSSRSPFIRVPAGQL